MRVARNTPMKLCIQLRDRALPGNTRIGEYVCLPPHIADAQARVGNVAVVTEMLKAQDVQDAGGWRKLLERNGKLRAMSVAEQKRFEKELEKFAPPPPDRGDDDSQHTESVSTPPTRK